MALERICVFCGASPGEGRLYLDTARAVGEGIARRGLGLVYGGASVGMMGAVADAALAGGAEVIGVLPGRLVEREIAHRSLTQFHVVASMHERKALMAKHASAFLALPGGFGTLDEIFEALTWAQIGIHDRPCMMLNVGGYYNSLLAFVDHAVREGLLRASYRSLLLVATSVDEALDTLASHPKFALPSDVDTSLA